MNVIIICSDTFRYDHLGFLKQQPVQTPCLDQLAKEAALFTDFRLCSFPTLVNRMDVFTGRHAFPFFNWGELPHQHPLLSEVFQRHGYTTGLFADNLHMMRPEWGYMRGFDHAHDTPGQMHDKFQPTTFPMIDLSCPTEKLDVSGYRLERYRRNAYWYRQRNSSTTAALFQSTIDWLANPPDKFFIWIDAFDPHEPWDAPEEFLKQYPFHDDADRIIWPRVGLSKIFTEKEMDNIRSLYRSEVSQVDHWVGALIAKLREKNLLDNTAILFCSDHGYYLGEHGLIGKPTLRRMPQPTLFYEELAHAPLLIRHPGKLGSGQQIPGLCQPADIYLTALDLAGIARVPWAQGHSLVPRLSGQPGAQHLAVGGSFPIKKSLLACIAVWTDEWCLMYNPFRGLDGSELYHRQNDPSQQDNLISSQPATARKLYDQMLGWFAELGVPKRRQAQLLRNARFLPLREPGHKTKLLAHRVLYHWKYGNYARRPSNS
jgi:arylsulfatase A-like enzyme